MGDGKALEENRKENKIDMRIIGGKVFGTDHKMHEDVLCFENGVITESSLSGEYDAAGCYVLPGLIDTHVHGANGIEFYWSEEDITPALDWLSRHGVTSILAGTCSETPEELEHDIKNILSSNDSRILGIHAEGPFINPKNKGGMIENRIQKPDCDTVKRIYDASNGKVKILTLAPELKGVEAVIDMCMELGIKVSMGHTSATYAEAKSAVDRGASRTTHTFNAMRGYNHREPGILGCGLDDERVNCELICDLHHVSAPAIRLLLRAKGPENVTMVSDCSKFCGRGDGDYLVGEHTIYVRDGFCHLADGTICGSSKCLSDGAKNMFHLGFKPEEIAIMAAVNPAKACGCTDRGEFKIGNRADIVIFDENFDVKAVFLEGVRI